MEQVSNIKQTIIITLVLMAMVAGLLWLNMAHGDTAASSEGASDEGSEGRATARQYYAPHNFAG